MGSLLGDSMLVGRVALVTGAARNLGRATAIAMADAGARGLDIDGGKRALAPDDAAYDAAHLVRTAPPWRARIKRFGGRTRR